MRKLAHLVSDFKADLADVPLNNLITLNLLGEAVQMTAKAMIGTYQIFWKDLAPSTIRIKRAHGWGRNGIAEAPLYATGEYERSVEYKISGKNKVKIFSELEYVKYLEFGTSKMSPRPLFKPAALIVLKGATKDRLLTKVYLKHLR